ncbi:very short patch repair endonuclease [Jeotgalibaca porci]|uniref:very short patch repair endonuclease n=1 Tax=Jeotgalibaca porci TaxID=1868793 RepID=UPI003F91511E
MNDKLSREQRSKVMSSIRAQSKLENKFSHALWRKGIRFRKNDRSLFGTPDISIKKYKLVVFVDSCFWHKCPIHGKIPKTNTKFWEDKLNRNVERDEEVTNHYISEGWNIYRIWEHELKSNFNLCVQIVVNFIENEKRKTGKESDLI